MCDTSIHSYHIFIQWLRHKALICTPAQQQVIRTKFTIHMLKDLITGHSDQSILHIPKLFS